MEKKNFCFMAFGQGAVTVDNISFKRYIGVAPVNVLAVNPNKAELEKICNRTIENGPEYISVADDNGTPVKQARIDFIVQTNADCCNGIDITSKVSFFVKNTYRFNRDQTKVQVIDKYGRTCWVTNEQCQNHEIPQYSNGPANIDKDYRPCFQGEEELTAFIKAYLNIPDVMRYINNQWVMVDNPQNSEARFEHIENYFNNDFSELKTTINMQPTNMVKVLFGVKCTDDGKQYQEIYNKMFLKYNSNNLIGLEKSVKERKSTGAYSTTEFEFCPLKEYAVNATNFDNTNNTDGLPFGNADNKSPWDFN